MNLGAVQDHRAAVVLDAPIQVLDTAPAPNPRAAQMLAILKDWRANGAIRIDADRNGFNDHPGVAILDAWWPRLADAVMTPVLGDLIPRLAELNSRGSAPEGTGNQSTGGWAGYVDKDLRTLLGQGVEGPDNVRYCGAGDLAACAADLWASLDAAGAELEAAQGTADPNAWRKSTEIERIRYLPEPDRQADRVHEPLDVPAGDQLPRRPEVAATSSPASARSARPCPCRRRGP